MALHNLVSRRFLSIMLMLPLLAACSKVGFSQESSPPVNTSGNPTPPGAGDPDAPGTDTGIKGTPVCQDIPALSRDTRIIYIVDQSGSNRVSTKNNGVNVCEQGDTGCKPPTDPNKTFRGTAIQKFFDKYQSKANFSWSFLTFAGNSANTLIGSSASTAITSDQGAYQGAINTFMATQDDGGTPYKKALQLAKEVISKDPGLNGSRAPQYAVVFVSDGFPSDYGTSTGAAASSAMEADINALVNAAPGSERRITLSTIYYGQVQDPEAIKLLTAMAGKGGGRFANAENVNDLEIDDVIPAELCD